MATISAAALADELGTDARTTRRFLRADLAARTEQGKVNEGVTAPGKGSQWAIEKRDVRALKARFTKWSAAQAEAKATRAADKAAKEAAEEAPEVAAEEVTEEV